MRRASLIAGLLAVGVGSSAVAAPPKVSQLVVYRDGSAVTRTAPRARRGSASVAGRRCAVGAARRSPRWSAAARAAAAARLRHLLAPRRGRRPGCSSTRSAATATAAATAGSTRSAAARAPRARPTRRAVRPRAPASGPARHLVLLLLRGGRAASARSSSGPRRRRAARRGDASAATTTRAAASPVEGATVAAGRPRRTSGRRRVRTIALPRARTGGDLEGGLVRLVRRAGRGAVRRPARSRRCWSPPRLLGGLRASARARRTEGGADLRVTRDFGHEELGSASSTACARTRR